jgi:uncharacterized protein
MRPSTFVPRLLAFILGLFLMGIGISLITKAGLGTSPISSLAYVLSLIFPLSFGQFTLLFSLVFLLLQLPILGKSFHPVQWLQALVGVAFGSFVDLGMRVCADLSPKAYPLKALLLLVGCLVMALGIYLEVRAQLVMNPGEGLVRVIAERFGKEFGGVKIVFDSTLVALAILTSLLAFGGIRGIREGTLVSAFLTGFLTRLIAKAEALVRRALPAAKADR